MSEKAENSSNPLDLVKWLVVLVLLGGAVAANSIYEDISVLYRALGVVAAVLVAGFIAASTEKGSSFLTFAKDARTEVRKVWPTRQEATQTTIIVLVATAFMSLVLWGLDLIIVQLVSFITGLGI